MCVTNCGVIKLNAADRARRCFSVARDVCCTSFSSN